MKRNTLLLVEKLQELQKRQQYILDTAAFCILKHGTCTFMVGFYSLALRFRNPNAFCAINNPPIAAFLSTVPTPQQGAGKLLCKLKPELLTTLFALYPVKTIVDLWTLETNIENLILNNSSHQSTEIFIFWNSIPQHHFRIHVAANAWLNECFAEARSKLDKKRPHYVAFRAILNMFQSLQ